MSRLNFPLNVNMRTILRNGIFLPQLILACLLFWLVFFFYFFRLTFFSLFANQERKCPFEPNMRGWSCQCTVRVCILFGASIHFNYNFPSFPYTALSGLRTFVKCLRGFNWKVDRFADSSTIKCLWYVIVKSLICRLSWARLSKVIVQRY